MKKGLLLVGGLVLLLVIVAGGITWKFFYKHRSVAGYLPEKTMVFLTIPNGTATALHYQGSQLQQVVNSHEIRGLTGVLLATLEPLIKKNDSREVSAHLNNFAESLAHNLSGESFMALTDFDLKKPENSGWIMGLHPLQGTGDFVSAVHDLAGWIRQENPKLTNGQGQHGPCAYEWVDLPNGGKLCFGIYQGWAIMTVGETALFDFVDRLSGNGATPSLAQSALFKTTQGKTDATPDGYVFINAQSILARVQEQSDSFSGANQKQIQILLESYCYMPAALLTARFNARQIDDRWIILSPAADRPDLGSTYLPCAYRTLPLTTQDTLFYGAQNIDLEKTWTYARQLYQKASPQDVQIMDNVEKSATSVGLDLHRNVLQALGPEVSLMSQWPDNAPYPDFSLVIQVADKNAFQPTADLLINFIKSGAAALGTISESTIGDNRLISLELKAPYPISPTLLVGNEFTGLFLTKSAATDMLSKAGSNQLGNTPTFQSLAASRMAGTCSLVYIDTPRLLKKAYPGIKSLIPLMAGYLPGLKDQLTSNSLPDQLSFADACGAYVLTTQRYDDSLIARSTSGIGNQFFSGAFLAGLGAGVAIPAYQKSQQTAHPTGELQQQNAATPENIRADMQELRAVIESWSKTQNIAAGTAVHWTDLTAFLIPGSPLEKSNGLDRLGNAYVLGTVGGALATVSDATKTFFASQVTPDFWTIPAPANPPTAAAVPDPDNTPSTAPAGGATPLSTGDGAIPTTVPQTKAAPTAPPQS